MRLRQRINIGAWVIIILNVMMSLGCIWIFSRMAPAIEQIILKNERSLEACEDMLAALILNGPEEDTGLDQLFEEALTRAANNITEDAEPAVVERIREHYTAAFDGDEEALTQTVGAITQLGDVNRAAMVKADRKARQLGFAGAWGVVFMASVVFLGGYIFKRALSDSLVKPFIQISNVIEARRNGDHIRRCTVSDTPKEIQKVFRQLNEVFDEEDMEYASKRWGKQ